MKTFPIASLLLLAVLLSPQLKSQSYTPFSFDNMQWTTRQVLPHFGLVDDDIIYWRISTAGDTIINGKNYTSLLHKWECWVFHDFSNNESYINQFPNAQYPHDNYLIGAIREEDKRVYFYPYTLSWLSTGGIYGLAPNQDHLLYDFNVAAGDTVNFSSTQWIELINGNPIYHSENHQTIINSVQTGGTYSVSPSDSWSFPNTTGTWTEGLGSSFGLFGSYDSFLTFLTCSGPTEEPSCSPCQSAVAVQDASWQNLVDVFPNPTSNELFIKNESDREMERIQLFDMHGRLLRDETCRRATGQYSLDISDWPGMFFILKISFEGGSFLNKKIVKK